MILRGIAVWLVIVAVEVVHGIARTLWLAPMVGDFRARQIAVFTGSALILAVATLFIRWMKPVDIGGALVIGAVWLVLTLAFEVAFGRFVVRATWARIAVGLRSGARRPPANRFADRNPGAGHRRAVSRNALSVC